MKHDPNEFKVEKLQNAEPVTVTVGKDGHVNVEVDRNRLALKEDSGYHEERVGHLSWREIDDKERRERQRKEMSTARAVAEGMETFSTATETFYNSPVYEKFKPAIESAKKTMTETRSVADARFSAVEGETVQTADGRTAELRKNEQGQFLGLFDAETGKPLSHEEENAIDWEKPENAEMKTAVDAIDTYRDARNVHDRRLFQAAEAVSMAEYEKTKPEQAAKGVAATDPSAPKPASAAIPDTNLTTDQAAQMQAEQARAANYNSSNPVAFVQDSTPANPKTTPLLASGFERATEIGAPSRTGEQPRFGQEYNPFALQQNNPALDPTLNGPKAPSIGAAL